MKRAAVKQIDLSPYSAIFEDIAVWDPDLRPSLARDFVRIERLVKLRGIGFVLVTMPKACKVIDFALSRGYLPRSEMPREFGTFRRGVPVFLQGLLSKLFDEAGKLRPEVDPTAVFFLRTVLNLCKKLKMDCEDATITKAVEEFYGIEAKLRKPTCLWVYDDGDFNRQRHFLDGLRSKESSRFQHDMFADWSSVPTPLVQKLQDVCDLVSSKFPEVDPCSIYPRHGPGAVADMKTGEDKYALAYWPEKLERVFPSAYFGQVREDLHLEVEIERSSYEHPARLLAVPKTYDKPRLIASEPVAHQYIQLGMMGWLRENLPRPIRSSISFTSQEPSRLAALKASKNRHNATVDLSSASDRLSCWVVERAFRKAPQLLNALHACRTRLLVNATGFGPSEIILLRKYAPQGNGTTFPVQTIIYTMVAIACILYERGQLVNSHTVTEAAREVRVYGDDIIVPSHMVCDLDSLLSYMELKVNVGKTHYTGEFRESCGMDAFRGCDVTPLYLTHLESRLSADELQSWIDVSNGAYLKGLWCLSHWMLNKLPEKVRKILPISFKELGCLRIVSFGPARNTETRYNRDLQRDEQRGFVPVVHQSTKPRDSYLNLLQYFVERPSADTPWVAGVKARARTTIKVRWVPTY